MRLQFGRLGAGILVVSMLLVTAWAGAAGAVTAITQPTGAPYVARVDAQGKPVPFTVVAMGFPAGSLVYVEQCDDRPPSAPNWLPTRDCDIGSSPAAVIVDAKGTATFPAGDVNHGFQAFAGLGPEGLFSCLAPNAPSLKNGLPEYHTCQLRVSSNNNVTTTDQTFMSFALASGPDASPSTNSHGSAPASSSSGSSSSSTGVIVIVVAVVIVALGAIGAFAVRRRRTTTAA